MLTTWHVWTGDKEHDPVSVDADMVRILPDDKALAFGGFDENGLFVFTAIFAPGTWTRVNQMRMPSKKEVLGQ